MTREARQSDLAYYQAADAASDQSLVPYAADGAPYVASSAGTTEPAGESLWTLVDDRLRGRWRWAIGTALVLGAALAVLGWRSTIPKYESVGVIRVTPRVPIILDRTSEWELNNFSMFVHTQVQLIQGRRVLEDAMLDRRLRDLEWAQQPRAQSLLEKGLEVSSDRNTELIYVKFESESPVVAQTVVNAVISSYDEIYGKRSGTEIGRTLENLRDLESRHRRELNRTRSEAVAILSRHGLDPSELRRMKTERIEELSQQLFRAERALANKGDQAPVESEVGLEPPVAVLAELERLQPELALLRGALDRAKMYFNDVRQRYRQDSPTYTRAKEDLDYRDMIYQQALDEALATWGSTISVTMPGALEGYESLPAPVLIKEIEELKAQESQLRQEVQALGGDIQLLKDKQEEEERIKNDIARVTDRIQELRTEEKNIAGRISIEQEGFRPLGPSSDGRKKRALFGMACGMALSFGLFFMLGTIDRRAFGASQLSQSAELSMLPLLGVLPDLGRSMLDPESSDVASHCVHQIRNQIEAIRDPRRGYVMAVSSPFQGDGKTSIVLSLGWSYAVAGYRVLVVDCDLTGRSLTRELGLGERDGLKEAIIERDGLAHTTSLAVENLDVLPVGTASPVGPETIRRADLIEIFTQLRDRYELIIVDTGPLLGALEATPVAAAVDGVVLSVRRGRSRTRLEECASRLASVGARCLGVVLNCATRADCYRSVSETSLSMAGEGAAAEARRTVDRSSIITSGRGKQNPLVLAMEMTSRPAEDHDRTDD